MEGVGWLCRGTLRAVCLCRGGRRPQEGTKEERHLTNLPVFTLTAAFSNTEPASLPQPARESHGCLRVSGAHVFGALPWCQENGLVHKSALTRVSTGGVLR